MTRVTVVSAFHNRPHGVGPSVESLLNQTHGDLEIIIADDGSTDETLERLNSYADPRLTVFTQPNAGFVATMNRLVARASGDYVAIHGAGDVSYPERIARQAALLDSDDRIGVVGCRVKTGTRITAPKGWDKPGPHPLLDTMLSLRSPFFHGEVMFRKSVFDRVGGYREAFRFAQDRDLWLRMGEHTDYAIVPEVLYERYHLADGVSRSGEKVVLQNKLSAFAVQCARERRAGRPDPLDRHGPAAFLLAQRSEAMARWLLRLGLGFARRGDIEGAHTVISAAARESDGAVRVLALILRRKAVIRQLRHIFPSERDFAAVRKP